MDPQLATYFDNVVPHRVFIHNGDTFIGKYLILLFNTKAKESSSSEDVSESLLFDNFLDQSATSYIEEENTEITEESDFSVPDEVFEGFLSPKEETEEDGDSDGDDEFWDYQLLGEFRMDLIGPRDYEYVISMKSNKMRKQYLYSLLRKNGKVSEEYFKNSSFEFNEYGENFLPNTPYEIYTSLKHPSVIGRKDPRYKYLEDTNVIELCFVDRIKTCGIIIFDTFTSNEPWAVVQIRKILQEIIPKFTIDSSIITKTQHLVVLSNLLTWASSDLLASTMSLQNLKERVPHPNYQNILDLENFCLDSKLEVRNKNLRLHIIGSGIPYGLEEDIFYHWFALGHKRENLVTLPVINDGNNFVPTIHINDLVKSIDYILEHPGSVKENYCIVMDKTTNTLREIVQALSETFTINGLVEEMPLEIFESTYPENLMYNLDQKKTALHLLSANLPLQSKFIDYLDKEIDLVQGGFIGSITNTLNDFQKLHKLKPVKILIQGQKFTGKTELAKKLADYFGIKHLEPEDLIEQRMKNLKQQIQYLENQIELQNVLEVSLSHQSLHRFYADHVFTEQMSEDQGAENIDDLSMKIMTHMEELTVLNDLLRMRYDRKSRAEYERGLSNLYSIFLKSKYVQWHGYVMDGWPNSFESCRLLFTKEGIKDDSQFEAEETQYSEELERSFPDNVEKSFLPDIVISLESDLSNPYMTLWNNLFRDYSKYNMYGSFPFLAQSSTISMDHENEEKIQEFSDFFKDIWMFPIIFNIDETSKTEIYENLRARFGKPRTLLGEEYLKELDRIRQEEDLEFEKKLTGMATKIAERLIQKRKEQTYLMEQWFGLNNYLHYERNVIQDLHRLSLTQYLKKYILPLLTRAIKDVAASDPDDPILYLLHYFFKENTGYKCSYVHFNTKSERFWNDLTFLKNKLRKM